MGSLCVDDAARQSTTMTSWRRNDLRVLLAVCNGDWATQESRNQRQPMLSKKRSTGRSCSMQTRMGANSLIYSIEDPFDSMITWTMTDKRASMPRMLLDTSHVYSFAFV